MEDISFKVPNAVSMNQDLKFVFTEKTILNCSIDFQVNNSDLIGIENKFDLYLIEQGKAEESKIEHKSFAYKIKGKNDQGTLNQVFKFEPGEHHLALYERVYNGLVRFSSIKIRCFALS